MNRSDTVTTVLVANRGEIARRVFASCRRAGLGTVAVFSDADADSPHVTEADVAVHLPGTAPADTYLRGEAIIAAARTAGADAIHPGYGFLSENAEFARAVLDAGLTWIGPDPDSIARMGSKVEAKKIMADAGVPVLAELDPAAVTEADLPVLIKASAGGGGRGMRVVRDLAELSDQLAAARREAQSAFGDPTVFCERYLETGRHIEVQVLADRHGTVWAVGERECSIQRRHQKVVEEAPSPLVDATPGMRERLFEAARRAAHAIDYEGAGTVEFLATGASEATGNVAGASEATGNVAGASEATGNVAGASEATGNVAGASEATGNVTAGGEFFFLEMNTRLQVEHPVTECTTGLDLVDLQLQIAAGGRLDPEPPPASGHSIEVRLYAEDPAEDWRPQSGTVHRLALPGRVSEFEVLPGPGLRLDAGVEDGSVVGVHYDPMLAKVIAYAPTRDRAARMLATSLTRAEVHGLRTNRDLLVNVLRHPEFLAGNTDTAFFDTHGLATLAAPLADAAAESLSALAAALADAAARRATATVGRGLPSGWRNLPSQPQVKRYDGDHGEHEVRYRLTRHGLVADGHPGIVLVAHTERRVVLAIDGAQRQFHVARYGDTVHVDSSLGPVRLRAIPRFVEPSAHVAAGSLLAPMPGSVIRIGATVGDAVDAGQPVLWLEAMKMEHIVKAPAAGVLTELPVAVGTQVELGAVLAVVTPTESTDTQEK
ncbi:acetyl-CoA carboxylase subunit alpha [Rhodococcus ruber Chol-4]|uniref:acetyl/propionyl/methylcrotonyl-CoA carboxylase subunit alpha n=1 Tax=Rhodococcus ruber TaxID=1830 RepID=UPI000346BC53|nr:biotin carboxylase N-terminal domain-containing protein [Rhodococcus ruber]AUM17744.1 acetyl/propionyl-CoA carboxylase subunit alpha [Rhodococcus ruber]KXF85173.1 acetyl-CoA carboxylase subunit alpha [Rhodococcus ruber Chol-4]MDO2379657.1 biotin carboxylase N-terminal domain-containing protein [Rhodococcus ruber]